VHRIGWHRHADKNVRATVVREICTWTGMSTLPGWGLVTQTELTTLL
jgi:hypothetical protein